METMLSQPPKEKKMRLIIIRHGDPDYSIDSLTEVGWIEAELLSEKISKMDVAAFYTSPLGRARHTAEPTLKKMGRSAEVLDWLREFPPRVVRAGDSEADCAWDWLPAVWTDIPEFYDKEKWTEVPCFAEANMSEEYRRVCEGLDGLLAKHGYERCGGSYKATKPSRDTVVLFCHFGLECVLLSHLMGVSPMVLWHSTCAAPTSVTTLYTEERREGLAYFRMASFGDVSHLTSAGREPSFAARFCELYTDDTRHD